MSGETVRIVASEVGQVRQYTPEVKRDIDAAVAVSRVHEQQSARMQLNIPAMKVGAGLGAVAGVGVGVAVVIEQAKSLHPSAAIALDAAFALIGSTMGAAVGSGYFKVVPSLDKEGKFSVGIELRTEKE